MMERLLPVIAGFAVSLVGLLLRSSRRSRFLNRIHAYTQLAAELKEHAPESSHLVRGLIADTVDVFVVGEQKSLRRGLDPAGVAAMIFLVSPALVAFSWAWTREESWRWAVITITALWALLWFTAGWSSMWIPAGEAEPEEIVD
jgi:hypothetical protein